MSHQSEKDFDLGRLPRAEDNHFEFKSSATSIEKLKEKLAHASSAFANSGGGCFVAGVNNVGDADGGLPTVVGRQTIRDWADQVIHQVEPAPSYEILLVDHAPDRGTLDAGRVILVVEYSPSAAAPHMAPDHRYYIRAGAHTVAASSFIVEALWARRHLAKPRLAHTFRFKPDRDDVIQLGIVNLTGAPALDVEINFSDLPVLLKGAESAFPLKVPVVDAENPFYLDVTLYNYKPEQFGHDVELALKYRDLQGNDFSETITVNLAVPPIRVGSTYMRDIVTELKSISSSLHSKTRG